MGYVAHGLCNTTWCFCGTCYYIRSHKGSCWYVRRRRKKGKELSGTRLDRLAKGAFVKIGSMAWNVWIHACSHGFLVSTYGFEGFHACIAMLFLLNNTWWWMLLEAGFFLQWGFSSVYLVSQFLWVCCLFSCMWIFDSIFISNLLWVMWKGLYSFLQVSLQVVSKLWFYNCNPRLNSWEFMRG